MINDKVWTASKDRTIIVWIPGTRKPMRKIAFDKVAWPTRMLHIEENVWVGGLDGKLRIFESSVDLLISTVLFSFLFFFFFF